MRKFTPHLGLRTFKTALSVVVSMLIASLFGEPSIFPALSSIAVMSRTFDEGLKECRNQAVGIPIGGVLGCVTVLLWGRPPIWLMGLGVMVIIFVCTSLHAAYSCSLSAALFIILCLTDPSEVISSTVTRLFHTAIGLCVGLAINYLIVPYDNSGKIYALLQKIVDCLPDYLDSCIFRGLYPDLSELDQLSEQLVYELRIYHHQRFRHRAIHEDEYVYMSGCAQLATRIHQELAALCCMDALGPPDPENLRRLETLDLQPPENGIPPRHSAPEDDAVTNYHLRKLLEAREFLLQLLEDRDQSRKQTGLTEQDGQIQEDPVAKLCLAQQLWSLSSITPIRQGPIASVYQAEAQVYGPVVLKTSQDSGQLHAEYEMLRRLQGRGCCRVYGFDAEQGLLLEARILPGTPLQAEPSLVKRIDALAQVFPQLHIPASDGETYLEWLQRAYAYCAQNQHAACIKEEAAMALSICRRIFEVYPDRVLLHGDLHHDNLLRQTDGSYAAIDPKGVIGPAILDLPRFVLNEAGAIHEGPLRQHLERVLELLSQRFGYPLAHLRKAYYMEAVLANIWYLEDGEPICRSQLDLAAQLLEAHP